MKYALSIIYTFLIFSFSTAQTIENHSIHFDFDKYNLNQEATSSLDHIHTTINQAVKYEIEIIGHTDQDGDYNYNNVLAQKRAKTVYDYLISKGVSAAKTQYLSKGEYDLLYPANDDKSKAKNRRVEIITKIYELENIEDLMAMLSPESNQQEFAISPTIQQRINGKEGTIVDIPENAFVFEDGSSPKGTVKVSLTEAFDFNAFMNHDLSCNSNGELLESGGMIKLTASSEGRELKMKEGKEIQLTYPEDKVKDGMELFYGEETAEGVSNWEATHSDIQIKQDITKKSFSFKLDIESLIVEKESEVNYPKFDFPAIPKSPTKPSKPSKPFKPTEPQKENIKLHLSLKEKIFLSREAKDSLINKEYQRKYNYYSIRLKRYEQKQAFYQKKMDLYPTKLEEYNTQLKDWKSKLSDLHNQVNSYNSNLICYEKIKTYSFAQKYLKKKIGTTDTLTLLYKYMNLCQIKHDATELSKVNKYRKKLTSKSKEYNIGVRDPFPCGQNPLSEEINPFPVDYLNKLIISHQDAQRMLNRIELASKKYDNIHNLGKYTMSVSRLGWINCDRFINVKEEDKKELALKADSNTKYYVVFKDMKSMLRPLRIKNEVSFSGIPINQEIAVLGIKLKNKKPFIFYKEMKLKDDRHLIPKFKSSSIDEISSVFASLGS